MLAIAYNSLENFDIATKFTWGVTYHIVTILVKKIRNKKKRGGLKKNMPTFYRHDTPAGILCEQDWDYVSDSKNLSGSSTSTQKNNNWFSAEEHDEW